ncbi:MAG TPA: SDR family NAD(P)-dependent oxidoreductase [Polyangiaceae bacterium]|nr:SDR family NAD(P)-dependent oxidoreductase [Polyangiaceae bacterium]
MKLTSKVVLVTGASAGIGEAVAREASQQGASVVLCARREERVQKIAADLTRQGGSALGLRCDVTVDEDVTRVVHEARDRFGGLDVLVANAGFGVQGRLDELELADYRRQFETNVFGVIRSIQVALPELKLRRGAIGVVGSANGYLSLPGWSAYCMSKHAVRSLCACVRHELGREGVSITHLAPGFVESEFRKVGRDGTLHDGARERVPGWLVMPKARAAREILRAIAERREEAVITRHARLVVGLERHLPRLVSLALGVSGGLVKALSKSP